MCPLGSHMALTVDDRCVLVFPMRKNFNYLLKFVVEGWYKKHICQCFFKMIQYKWDKVERVAYLVIVIKFYDNFIVYLYSLLRRMEHMRDFLKPVVKIWLYCILDNALSQLRGVITSRQSVRLISFMLMTNLVPGLLRDYVKPFYKHLHMHSYTDGRVYGTVEWPNELISGSQEIAKWSANEY